MVNSASSEPIVWMKYECEKSGKVFKIRIQQITQDLYDRVVDLMAKYFLTREPISSSFNFEEDIMSLDVIKTFWINMMQQGTGLVAILDEGNQGQEQIVGANLLGISEKNDKTEFELKGEKEKINKILAAITKEGNIYEKYGVDRYLNAMGLTVHPDFHGLGIGLKLLECREKLCKHFGLKMTATVFTAASSQHIARKCGFHTIVEHEYNNYSIDGEILYPNLIGKITLMAKVYN